MRHRASPARRSRGTEASKDDPELQRNTWPGLALAGGVLIAAIVTLLVLGGGGGKPPAGMIPGASPPASTRILPGTGDVAGETRHASRHRPPKPRISAFAGSAAASQYGADGNRGTVLGGP